MKSWLPSSEAVEVVHEARQELSGYLARLDIDALSKHNRGYRRYLLNPVRSFIDLEITRYVRTVDFINKTYPRGARVLDIGLFVPVVPIALAKLGFTVASVENLGLYGGSLDEIISLITGSHDVSVYDLDILGDHLEVLRGPYDVVLLLAILEHLNGTPRDLLTRAASLLSAGGHLVVDVPNAAALSNRISFLWKGLPPYPPFPDYYHSAYPFAGHNREYTIPDLRYALEQSDLNLVTLDVFHHGTTNRVSMKARLLRWFERVGPADWKPCIWAVAQK